MNRTRWDPITDLRHAMDRVIDESVRPLGILRNFGDAVPVPLDIYQTPSNVMVKAAVPGINPDDVEITISGDMLTIRGEIKTEEEVREEDYIQQERRLGSFSRTIAIPTSVQGDQAQASSENGILTITIPKTEASKPKQIKIQPKS